MHDGRQGMPLRCQWDDVRINIFQRAIQCGVRLENVFGTVTLSGQSDGQRCFCRGELNLESLNFKDCQFKNVWAPSLSTTSAYCWAVWSISPPTGALF